MKEAFVILLVIAILLALTAVKYRRQIVGAIEIWRSMKAFRDQLRQKPEETNSPRPVNAGKLVNCAKCGTWVPEDRAIRLKNGTYFCSSACVESLRASAR
jgi:hypothetical protein